MVNIEDYPDYQVIIRNTYTKESIAGLLDNAGFGMSTGASWSPGGSLEESLMDGGLGFIAQLLSKKAGAGAGQLAKNAANSAGTTMASTLMGYNSSSPVSLDAVNFHVFNDGKGFKHVLRALYNLTQPTVVAGFMKSNLYNPTQRLDNLTSDDKGVFDNPFEGQLIHLDIGHMFFTGLVCDSVSYKYSKNVGNDGKPLYMSVTASFKPHKVNTTQEMLGWTK